MATRLLSFLNDIEQALLTGRTGAPSAWNCQRMVNFKDGLARMTLSAPAAGETAPAGGAILIQSFLLADGALCLKALLSWERSPATTTIAVHAKPLLDWATEARQIAGAWLAGPPATASVEAVPPVAAPATVPSPRAAQTSASG
jgi:hypothetical protein